MIGKLAQLDGSKSSTGLKFSWRAIGKSASTQHADTVRPSVQLTEGFGLYTFELTVTDLAGATATSTTRVFHSGQ